MKQFNRKEMMKFISKYMNFVRTTEDFFGTVDNEYSGGIWVSGDLSEKNRKYRGKTIYNHHSILKSWEAYLNSKGWTSEWYDGGTIFIYKKG